MWGKTKAVAPRNEHQLCIILVSNLTQPTATRASTHNFCWFSFKRS